VWRKNLKIDLLESRLAAVQYLTTDAKDQDKRIDKLQADLAIISKVVWDKNHPILAYARDHFKEIASKTLAVTFAAGAVYTLYSDLSALEPYYHS
jgi:hypothetical protein